MKKFFQIIPKGKPNWERQVFKIPQNLAKNLVKNSKGVKIIFEHLINIGFGACTKYRKQFLKKKNDTSYRFIRLWAIKYRNQSSTVKATYRILEDWFRWFTRMRTTWFWWGSCCLFFFFEDFGSSQWRTWGRRGICISGSEVSRGHGCRLFRTTCMTALIITEPLQIRLTSNLLLNSFICSFPICKFFYKKSI